MRTRRELEKEAALVIQRFVRKHRLRLVDDDENNDHFHCHSCAQPLSRNMYGLQCDSPTCSGEHFRCNYCFKSMYRCRCNQPSSRQLLEPNSYECGACFAYNNQEQFMWCEADGFGCTCSAR